MKETGSMALLVKAPVLKAGVVGSSPTVGKTFHFEIIAFFAYLTTWLSDYKWNQAWHTPSQYPLLAESNIYLLVHLSFKSSV